MRQSRCVLPRTTTCSRTRLACLRPRHPRGPVPAAVQGVVCRIENVRHRSPVGSDGVWKTSSCNRETTMMTHQARFSTPRSPLSAPGLPSARMWHTALHLGQCSTRQPHPLPRTDRRRGEEYALKYARLNPQPTLLYRARNTVLALATLLFISPSRYPHVRPCHSVAIFIVTVSNIGVQ